MPKKTNMKEENDIIKASFTVDDSPIFDALDNYFASLPLNVLEEARKQNIENGEDTEIIDKTIKERIRKDAELKKTQEKIVEKERQYQREKRKAIRKSILAGIFSSFIDKFIIFSIVINNYFFTIYTFFILLTIFCLKSIFF